MQLKYTIFIIGALIGGAIGAFAVYQVMGPYRTPSLNISPAMREQITDYRFIDPLLVCNSPEATTGKYEKLDEALTQLIATAKEQGKADSISLYFQEYPSGRWVGIDQDHQYDPASLLKIVLMIAYFKDEELHPGSLLKNYTYTRSLDDINSSIPYDSTSSLVVGGSYSAEQLIESMIIDSDNGAKDILLANANNTTLDKVYADLQIPNPATNPGEYKISPKAYSLFFRILYNATYLDRSLSEKAMSILAKARYVNGLVAGVPKGTTVAHKFGEHVNETPSGGVSSVELHDCGVVYGPNLPYFLCVMTTGKSVGDLESTIQDTSKAVFSALDTSTAK